MKQIKRVNELVIGGNLAALEYAYREGLPIFYEQLEVPFHLEKTNDGNNKKDIIENYAFLLSMAGLNLSSPLVGEHRLSKGKLTLTGRIPWILEIHYDKLHDYRISKRATTTFRVVDYINVRSCGPHDLRELNTKHRFVKEIYFYPSLRTNKTKKFSNFHDYETATKDVMLVSYLKGSEIEKEKFSPIYSRLKLKEIMIDLGIKGKKYGKQKSGKIKYRTINLEFDRREINEIEEYDRNLYYSQSKNEYLEKLRKYMYGNI